MRTITVIGSINIDLVCSGDRLPAAGETVLARQFRVVPGGKGANQAVAAARLGASVRFIGCVGRDEYGRMARENLRKQGVDVRAVRTVSAHTGVALISVDAAGRNLITVAPGANAHVRSIGRHDIALTQLETPYKLPRARTVILNPAPAREVSLSGVDILIANEIEA
ncbi:MAG TPA: PfkB family carbohydrate kinase, partial [Phycisphaerae bacterium]